MFYRSLERYRHKIFELVLKENFKSVFCRPRVTSILLRREISSEFDGINGAGYLVKRVVRNSLFSVLKMHFG